MAGVFGLPDKRSEGSVAVVARPPGITGQPMGASGGSRPGRGHHPDPSPVADSTVRATGPLLESLDTERRATLIATPTGRRSHRFDIRPHGAGQTVLLEFS